MNLRFKVLSAAFLVLLMLANNTEMRPFDSVYDVFVGLIALLLLSIIALWPNSSRTDRVDRAMSGDSWADRIDIERISRDQSERAN